MAMFDYKNYTSEESAELLVLAHRLTTYRDGSSENFGPASTVDQRDRLPFDKLPPGWRELTSEELGLPQDAFDSSNYFKIDSAFGSDFIGPLDKINDSVNGLEGGGQAKILGEHDDQGNLTKVAITFLGTSDLRDWLDFTQLNSGAIAQHLEPLLAKVKEFVLANGLTPKDVIVTGESLGGAMTNIMARFREKLADGFFSESDYIAHSSPAIYDADPDIILNYGYENDTVFRIMGDESNNNIFTAIADALKNGSLTHNPDLNYDSSVNNIILFNNQYASYAASGDFSLPELGVNIPVITSAFNWLSNKASDVVNTGIDTYTKLQYSIINQPGTSWSAHYDASMTNAQERIADSPFYDYTHKNSVVVVSVLSESMRDKTWVEDFKTPLSDHYGQQVFLIGSRHNDLVRDGENDDYLYGGAGNDTLRLSGGVDRVDGGEGHDTLRLESAADDWEIYRLSDGSLFFDPHNERGLKQVENVESVIFDDSTFGFWRAASMDEKFKVDEGKLIDVSRGKHSHQAYKEHTEGTTGDDQLSGRTVFAGAGDDELMAMDSGSLLHGGEGSDLLVAGLGTDRLYGAEGNDVLVAQGDGDLHGGQGNDHFVFDSSYRGQSVIEDFNQNVGDLDKLVFDDELFANQGELWANATQSDKDVVISTGNDSHVTIKNIGIAELQDHSLIIA